MRYLFISDLHLEAERPDITRAFLSFLRERAPAADALYILGDFFEVWLGDDAPNPLAREIAAALAQLASQGVKIFLMHGNRDFLIGRRFCREARCVLLRDPCLVELNGDRVLLMHGDSLCIDDLGYIKMRRWLRNPASRFILRNLPLKTRHRIGRKLRAESMARTRLKASDITDVNLGAVADAMRQFQVHTLIHGHTHRPAVHDLMIDGQPAERIVLGDWDKRGWVLTIDQDGRRLESFELAGDQ